MKKMTLVVILALALLLVPVVAYAAAFILTIPSTVTIIAPSGGGGGGGGDTTPPIILDISLCEDPTETTATICWETNEKSTSQVEYWASPSMLSLLDKKLVTKHSVHLTDLTPGTIYHYKTMSKDSAGNLRVSSEQTFTTLGIAPVPPAPEPTPAPVTPKPAPPTPAPVTPVAPVTIPETPIPANHWPLYGAGIGVVVVLAGLFVFWRVRRRAV